MPSSTLIDDLQPRQHAFAAERDWEHFHTSKNLTMALIVEAGELQEIFQWLSEEQLRRLEPAQREHVAEELADVLSIDLGAATHAKLRGDAKKYPAASLHGNAAKYDEYQ